ncbi:TonB-dependent receptor [Formosa sp. S-31]|uniref:TonB-dependent receptor n=1 Tax=Formosa sp. S-31 TaxID=2790949 RepID=UPI003EBCA00B
MRKQIQYIFILVALVAVNLISAQEKDTIQTDVINVVKPYTPTISDAFKVKTTPTLDDNATTEKKDVQYEILSVPVASTFTPTKGKAATIEREKSTPFFDNYAKLGFGSFKSLLAEVYVTKEIKRTGSLGAYLSHMSSRKGLEDKILDDGNASTQFNLDYIKRYRDLTWSIKGGLNYKDQNWYGVPNNFNNATVAKRIDQEQAYYDVFFGGDVSFDYTYIKSGSLEVRRFLDGIDSNEYNITFDGTVDLPIMDQEISTDVTMNFLSGMMSNAYSSGEKTPEYKNILFGVSPSYKFRRDDLTLDIGLSIYYLLGMKDTPSDFYALPNVTGSYSIVEDVLVAYGGLKGDVIQNTYRDLVGQNPFVSPTLDIKPTELGYNAFLGVLGKFTNTISYNVKASYLSESDKPLFQNNAYQSNYNGNDAFRYGNSFGVVYDDVRTFKFKGELTVDANRNLKMGLRAEYFNYNTKNEAEAWNLPDIKASVFGDYQSDQKWFAGANLFYVGGRKDLQTVTANSNTTSETIKLKGYIDLNLNAGYNVNERLAAFVRLNNIANQNYERFNHYNVQGFQALAGATYKFDF